MTLTKKQLQEIIDYSPGGCLCGHGEKCEVCSRSEETRVFEKNAKQAAKELIAARRLIELAQQ